MRENNNNEEPIKGGVNYKAKVETPKKESWLKRVWNTIKWIFSW